MRFQNRDEWEVACEEVITTAYEQSGREDELEHPEWVTMAEVLEEPAPGEDDFEEWKKYRVIVIHAFLRFLWADGPHVVSALKRLYAATRRISPEFLCHMTLDQVAVLLNETKQATQSREERVIEKFLEGLGFKGTRGPRSKSDEARAKYSEQRKGTKSRLGGKKAVRKYSALRSHLPAEDQAQHCG